MKRTALLLALVVFLLVASVFIHRARHKPTRQPAHVMTGAEEILNATALDANSYPIHLSITTITKLASTASGREILCSEIGTEDAGLDTVSYIATQQALLNQEQVEDTCLEPIVQRL